MEDYFEGSTAIIGAGFAGLAAANRLASKGIPVTVYDMGSRGPGGRASSREFDIQGGYLQFDHGCQFIMASDLTVAEQVREWECQRFLREWKGRFGCLDCATGSFEDRADMPEAIGRPEQGFCGILGHGRVYVGSSCMVDACSAMYQQIGIKVKWGEQVMQAVRQPNGNWELTVETRHKNRYIAHHRNLVLADQMNVRPGSHGYVDLKEYNTCELSQRVQAVKRSPRYSLMIALKKEAINAPFDGVTVKNSQIIEWISKDSSKPGRDRDDGLECWVVVTTEEYAQELISEMPLFKEGGQYVPQTKESLNDIAKRIWDALKAVLEPFIEGGAEPAFLRAQRWASAYKADLIEEPCVTDLSLGLAMCGDFCGQSSSAEGAILSGLAAADSMTQHALKQLPPSPLQAQ